MAEQKNGSGTRILISVLTGIVMIGVAAVFAYNTNRITSLFDSIREHEDLPAHPAQKAQTEMLLEMIREAKEDRESMESDISDIKRDVGILLDRSKGRNP